MKKSAIQPLIHIQRIPQTGLRARKGGGTRRKKASWTGIKRESPAFCLPGPIRLPVWEGGRVLPTREALLCLFLFLFLLYFIYFLSI
jgi:hypothetical protein